MSTTATAPITGCSEGLLAAKNFCHVDTLCADGSVHGVPVWIDEQDGLPTKATRAAEAAATARARAAGCAATRRAARAARAPALPSRTSCARGGAVGNHLRAR